MMDAKSKEAAWHDAVNVGDMLIVNPFFNKTERPSNHIPTPCEVLAVIPMKSQSGVMFRVRANNGAMRDLDAGWFQEPK